MFCMFSQGAMKNGISELRLRDFISEAASVQRYFICSAGQTVYRGGHDQ